MALLRRAHEGAARFEVDRAAIRSLFAGWFQRPGRGITRRELLRRQEFTRGVEYELDGLKRERHRQRALERHTRLSIFGGVHFQIRADGLSDDRNIDCDGCPSLTLSCNHDLFG